MKTSTLNRPTNFQAFRRRGVVPGQYDKAYGWYEQHPFFYLNVAKRTIIAMILVPLFLWGIGESIDWQIDEGNRRSCDMAYHNEAISHPLVQKCLKYYSTGDVTYMRDLR